MAASCEYLAKLTTEDFPPQRTPNACEECLAAGTAWVALREWARRHQPRVFSQLHKDLFEAHFVLGEDLEDPAVIDRHASESGIDLTALHAALADGSAAGAVEEAKMIGRKYGVQGTPVWLLDQRLITGLRPAAEFERLAEWAIQLR